MLSPAGTGADRIAELFWWMLAGGLVIWVAVVALGVYAVRARPHRHSPKVSTSLIVGGGVVLPVVLLTALLWYGLKLIPTLQMPGGEPQVRVVVTGEQWWWRVRYRAAGADPIELANEIRLPVGATSELLLESADVIHSLWIPAIAGKVDMIPGRTNRLIVQPTETGVFRGVCAEYCGTAHAAMEFSAVVMEPEAFADWLAAQAQPAIGVEGAEPTAGETGFLANGCGACHRIRGTAADGRLGPDLTHVASRVGLAAGVLPNRRETLKRWIREPHALKPGVRMPAFDMLPEPEIEQIAAFLDSLQ